MLILGLGSNFGDRLAELRRALSALRSREFRPILQIEAISSLYESDAMLLEGAPPAWNQDFLNLAVRARSRLTPPELLVHLKELERKLGRQTRPRWAPREIDIDLLLVDDVTLRTETLELPHPGLRDRPFALLPVAELAPDWVYPSPRAELNRPARELAQAWIYGPPEAVPFHTRRSGHSLTELVGILNLTPDSFSDGGRFSGGEAALWQAEALVSQGATVLDLGAESTRPGATPVSLEVEWSRLAPVLEVLGGKLAGSGGSPGGVARTEPVRISVDTRNEEVARRALAQSATPIAWLNDVSGGENCGLVALAARAGVDYVFMHNLGVPPTAERTLPSGEDPVERLLKWGEEKVRAFVQAGIPRERLIFDPGLGFGKTLRQTQLLIQGARRFQELGVRVLIGHSRKSFLRQWLGTPLSGASPADRDLETALLTGELARAGVDYLRVHDIALNRKALTLTALLTPESAC